MDESRIKALYRRHTESTQALDIDAVHASLGRHGFPDQEDTAIDRVAANAMQADVLRLVMALGPDAEALRRDVAALRRPRHAVPQFLRRGLALAAGVGALAVLFAVTHNGPRPGAMDASPASSQSIMSGSFEPGMESAQDRIELQTAAPIFSGDFDS